MNGEVHASTFISLMHVFPSRSFITLYICNSCSFTDNNNLEGTLPMELGAFLIAESIELHNNNIKGFVPTSICDNILPLGELGILTADCSGGDNDKSAMVECNCCTLCH